MYLIFLWIFFVFIIFFFKFFDVFKNGVKLLLDINKIFFENFLIINLLWEIIIIFIFLDKFLNSFNVSNVVLKLSLLNILLFNI